MVVNDRRPLWQRLQLIIDVNTENLLQLDNHHSQVYLSTQNVFFSSEFVKPCSNQRQKQDQLNKLILTIDTEPLIYWSIHIKAKRHYAFQSHSIIQISFPNFRQKRNNFNKKFLSFIKLL